MKSLKDIIAKARRGPKPSPKHRWINTHVDYAWDDARQEYVEKNAEGFWYDGPMALAHDVSPIWVAEDYRWYDDDAAIPNATASAAENTAISVNISATTQRRLRINVAETNGAAGTGLVTGSWTLQYDVNSSGTWTTVGAATDVRYYDSANLTNDADIIVNNFVLTYSGNEATIIGAEVEDGVSPSVTDWSNQETEYEFTVDFAANLSDGDTVTFRVLDPAGGAVTFTNVPTANITDPPKTASGSPQITKPTASGVATNFNASGSPSISKPTATGNAAIPPRVWLNSTQSLSGATEMTVTAYSDTEITFTDPSGPPTGSLFIGVERSDGQVGWLAVTVNDSTKTASGAVTITKPTATGVANH